MNRKETIQLHERGADAWNEWAKALLDEKQHLDASADTTALDLRNWQLRATADFSGHSFEATTLFTGLRFPGRVDFAKAQFHDAAVFNDAQFLGQATPVDTSTEHMEPEDPPVEVSFANSIFHGVASFKNTTFGPQVVFTDAQFSGAVLLAGSAFRRPVDFSGARFLGDTVIDQASFARRCSFRNASFARLTSFQKTTFGRRARFDGVQFEAVTAFRKCVFRRGVDLTKAVFADQAILVRVLVAKGEATLQDARISSLFIVEKSTFQGSASFFNVQFSEMAMFKKVAFHRSTSFLGAKFCGTTLFHSTTFRRNAVFTGVDFQGLVNFEKTKFRKHADFSSARARGNLSLTQTSFERIPNFCQAYFDAPPEFDSIGPVPPRSWSSEPRSKSDDWYTPQAKWRTLRRLANQGGDTLRELQFLKGEIKSRRGHEDRWTSPFYWIGWAYQFAADFGLSVVRPAIALLASIVVFGVLYAAQGDRTWSELHPAPNPSETHRIQCNLPGSALVVSLHSAFPFAGVERSGRLTDAYECLYGDQYLTRSIHPNSQTILPVSVICTAIIQFLVTATLLFLLVLGIRNRFRIGG